MVAFITVAAPFIYIFIFSEFTGVKTEQVFLDLGTSFMRVLVAYVISVAAAIPLAFFLGQGKIGDFFLPVFDVLQSFPSFALLPLLVIWFGIGNAAAIFFLVATMIWPVLFSVLSSLRLSRKDLEEAAFIFGARGWKKMFVFTLPLSLPGLIIGSIVGIGEGWEAIVGAEIIGITPGIGGFLNSASNRGDIPVLTFGIIALLLFLFTLNKLIWIPLLKRSHDYAHE